MAGYGLAGFGGGLAQGLAGVLTQHRQQQREDEARRADLDMRGALSMLPYAMQHMMETGDPSFAEQLVVKINPAFEKQIKKDSPFAYLGPLLQGQAPPTTTGADVGLGGAVGAAPASVTTDPTAGTPPPAPIEPVGRRQIQVSPRTFLGMPVLTPEQRAERGALAKSAGIVAEGEGNMRLADMMVRRGIFPDQKSALAALGVEARSIGRGSTAMRYGGTLKGDQVPAGGTDQLGQPINPESFYRVQIHPDGEMTYVPTVPPRVAPSAGSRLEAAAQLLGFDRLADVPDDRRAEVEAKAKELEQQFGFSGGYGRGIGTRQAEIDTLRKSGIVQTVVDNPLIWAQLPDEAKSKLAPLLAAQGFDFARGTALTPSMAAGVSRLTSSLKMLQELDPSLTQKTGLGGRVAGTAQQWWSQLTQEESPVTIYQGVSESLLPALARASGEVGNLAEKEQTRYNQLAPKVSDASNVRQAKYAAIQYLIDSANRGATAAEMAPFLDYMKFAGRPTTPAAGPGAPPAAEPKGPLYVKSPDGKRWLPAPPQ